MVSKRLMFNGLPGRSWLGRLIATGYDIMVHYDPAHQRGQSSPHICPKCGSHRTQVVGRSLDSKSATVRCASCGERSRVGTTEQGDGGEAAA